MQLADQPPELLPDEPGKPCLVRQLPVTGNADAKPERYPACRLVRVLGIGLCARFRAPVHSRVCSASAASWSPRWM